MEIGSHQQFDSSLKVSNLTVGFAGKVVVRDVSLEVAAGSMTVILGRSGSGKTTFLRALNRLNECFPGCRTTGSVSIHLSGAWVDVYRGDLPLSDLRRRVGMVFQDPNVLPVSIERNLSLPLKLGLGISGRKAATRIETALTQAELWEEVRDRLSEPAVNLSGGQQQRLCLARALVLRPEVLLLDEPTASLDFKASQKIEALLHALKKEYTIILVSHSLSQTGRLADRILVLQDGRLVKNMGAGDLTEPDKLKELIEGVF